MPCCSLALRLRMALLHGMPASPLACIYKGDHTAGAGSHLTGRSSLQHT